MVDPAPKSPEPLPPEDPRRSPWARLLRLASDNAIYTALVVLVLVIALYSSWMNSESFKEFVTTWPDFLTLGTLRNILMNSSTRLIVAFGAFFAIVTAGADLSAGRMVGLAAVVSASMLQAPTYLRLFYPDLPQLPLVVPVLAAVAACTLFGLFNGLCVARLGVAPFIATLGSMSIIHGANSLYFDKSPNDSQPIGGLRADFTSLGTGAIGSGPYSVPYIVIFALVVAVFMWVLLNKTAFGKNTYAIGGNVNAARVSGINVGLTTVVMYSLAGALYGLGGVLEAARTGGATNNYGTGYELDAIAACVVGGVSVTGGIGTVKGIIAGVFILTVINFGLTFINLNPYWQLIIKGVIIISAVAFDVRKVVKKR